MEMPLWLAILCSTGIASLLIKEIYDLIKNSGKKAKEALKKQKQDEMREVIREEIDPMVSTVSAVDDRLSKVCRATKDSLKNDILTIYYRCNEKGYRNDYDYMNIHALYDDYNELHGNSFVEDIMTRFDHLPVKEDIKQVHI